MHAAVRDLTDFKLRQSQKLEALGQVAAGIAHELSTPLQALGDNAQFLREAFRTLQPVLRAALADPHPPAGASRADLAALVADIPAILDETLEAIARACDVVRAMGVLAHPGADELIATNLNRVATSALVLTRSRIRGVATVDTALADLPAVLCHPGLVSQVIINLLINAADAVEEKVRNTGELGTIRLATVALGPWVELSVSDSGMGIPEGIQAHIFEPFFTTKPLGAGSGQGLAIARMIVEQYHRGRISFVSRPGQGTTFTVRLPVGGPAAVREA